MSPASAKNSRITRKARSQGWAVTGVIIQLPLCYIQCILYSVWLYSVYTVLPLLFLFLRRLLPFTIFPKFCLNWIKNFSGNRRLLLINNWMSKMKTFCLLQNERANNSKSWSPKMLLEMNWNFSGNPRLLLINNWLSKMKTFCLLQTRRQTTLKAGAASQSSDLQKNKQSNY